ncbi:LysR substrate-binding domain-containing protein [Yersinia pseudotuberculosis]|uniref:LysR substrate-binding domain-containing protein n=1 Tax=Yersinia pseudotuberculosis TaxID=633 RepID=UPI0005E3FC80|nr:LysR substrate-binding domain-containing protein [Yersinia pseudotuberculosis]CNC80312.1 LysR family transcriptional regulator [Yersinia pseudotuberculosis]
MLRTDISLKKLNLFLHYMQNRKVSLTADRLGVSRVSVHRTLHSLEEELELPLFSHQGKSLIPLESAYVLAEQAALLMEQYERCIHLTCAAATNHNLVIKLGVLYSLTASTAPQLITGMKQRQAGCKIELTMNSNQNLIGMLCTQSLDAIIISTPEDYDPNQFETLPLFEDDVYLALPVSHPRAQDSCADLADYRDSKFVTLTEGFSTYKGFQQVFRIAGFEPDIAMQVRDIFSLMNLVGSGIGCSLVPGRLASILVDKVKLLPLAKPFQFSQSIALVFPRNNERRLLPFIAECRMHALSHKKK